MPGSYQSHEEYDLGAASALQREEERNANEGEEEVVGQTGWQLWAHWGWW